MRILCGKLLEGERKREKEAYLNPVAGFEMNECCRVLVWKENSLSLSLIELASGWFKASNLAQVKLATDSVEVEQTRNVLRLTGWFSLKLTLNVFVKRANSAESFESSSTKPPQEVKKLAWVLDSLAELKRFTNLVHFQSNKTVAIRPQNRFKSSLGQVCRCYES